MTGIPRKTIDDPHPKGTQALDISPDGRYIVTLSRDETRNAKNQIVTLWEWQSENPEKISSYLDSKIRPEEYQDYIRFNPDNQGEFATTGKTIIFFWNWESSEKGFTYYEPATLFSLRQKFFTQTAFIPGNTQAVTGTEDGFIVVWDISLIMEDFSLPEERRAVKVVNLMNTAKKTDSGQQKGPCSINILKIEDNYLVIGSSNGDIRFYDFQYRIIAWFEHINIGSITTISFAEQSSILADNFNYDDQLKEEQTSPNFKCADFIVVDLNARITQLNYKLFSEIDKDRKPGTVLLQSIVKPIVSISVRPNSQEVAIFCNNGYLYQWNFQEKNKQLTLLKEIENDDKEKDNTISACIDYSPDGQYLSVADSRGKIHICDIKLKEELDKRKQKELSKDKEDNKDSEEKKKYRDPWQQPLDVSEVDKYQKKPRVKQQIFSPLQEVKQEIKSADNKIIETKQMMSKYLATMDDDYGICLFVLGKGPPRCLCILCILCTFCILCILYAFYIACPENARPQPAKRGGRVSAGLGTLASGSRGDGARLAQYRLHSSPSAHAYTRTRTRDQQTTSCLIKRTNSLNGSTSASAECTTHRFGRFPSARHSTTTASHSSSCSPWPRT